MNQPADFTNPVLIAAVVGAMIMFGFIYYLWEFRNQNVARSEVKSRLDTKRKAANPGTKAAEGKTGARTIARQLASRTNAFYSTNDPVQKRKMQMRLIQAGFMNPQALGYFLAARIGMGLAAALVAGIFAFFFTDMDFGRKIILVLISLVAGYYAPNFYINDRIKKLRDENRAGFPDVMDLMVVAAEAGLTTEASIERISHEIARTYPSLSENLTIASIEIRAGRPLDEALRAFGERLGLEEVQGFSTMIQQSKELGTSVSEALRVYSDEMRHKRMMAAEEKAYALPAKLSIPVTAFILPIVIGVAVIPTIVRIATQ